MKTLACLTATLGLLGAIAAVNPAAAAAGQCFDAYGRPVGPPHNTDNPPYGLICSVYRQGGQCTHVQPQWAEANCGIGPRHGYSPNHGYQPNYGYQPRYRYQREREYPRLGEGTPRRINPRSEQGLTPQQRELQRLQRANPGQKYTLHPDQTQAPTPDRGPPNNAR